MLHYILQTVAFQLFFLIVYDVFLKNETFFNWNRFYLLITSFGSIVLPFIKFESIKTMVPEQFVIHLPEVIIGNVESVTITSSNSSLTETITSSGFIWRWEYILFIGMAFTTLLLIYKVIKISNLIQKNPKRWKGNLIIVNLLKSNAAFSFFHYIFLGEWIKEAEKETILNHELVHVQHKHSWDLLLFEMFRILFWFNPLIYMYQNRMTTLHEYIADAKAMKQGNKKHYYEKLLSQIFDTEHISFTNTFFKQSLIKKRIVMLSRSKSNRLHLLKYALLVPMVFGMLMYTSSYAQIKTVEEPVVNQELSFEQLADNYYKEIIEMAKNGAGMQEIQTKYDMENNRTAKSKYIKSIEDVAKMKAFNIYSAEEFVKSEKAQGTYTEAQMKMVKSVLDRYITYEHYLVYLTTDEAISNWESDINDGELRLVVNDINHLTKEEQAKQAEKLALIQKDDYLKKLKITDGKTTTTMDVDKVVEIQVREIEEGSDIEVPFSVIDEVPTLESCKDLASNDEKRTCLSSFISDFVNNNFNTNLANDLGLTGKQRITVLFKIGTDGKIKDVMSRAPHPALEAEAKRVIKALPQFIPGRQKGKAVVVPYSLPILFQVQNIPTPIETKKGNKP